MPLIDVKHTSLKFNFVVGEEKQALNPLGSCGFDDAEILNGNPLKKLEHSPFLYAWSSETEQQFAPTKGIWLSSEGDKLFLNMKQGIEYTQLIIQLIKSGHFSFQFQKLLRIQLTN